MTNPRLTILVTTFNQEGNIQECIRRILQVYPTDCEARIVDGGFDRTRAIVKNLETQFPAVRYVRNENDRGKGHAVQTRIGQAHGQLIAQIDADCSSFLKNCLSCWRL